MPATWGECNNAGPNAERPCPYVGCSMHLYLDVDERTGSIKFNFPELEPWELVQSCALDVPESDPDGITLELTGEYMNLTRERIRQVEAKAFRKLKRQPGTRTMMRSVFGRALPFLKS